MGTQTESSYNPAQRSSGKRVKRAIPLAAKVARELGLVPTWPTLQIVRLAIESESRRFGVQVREIAELFIRAGNEYTELPRFSCPPEWRRRMVSRANTVDRFWFEDARWRYKLAYQEFVSAREREHAC